MFIDARIGFAVFDFVSVEESSGDLVPMLAQVRRGLAWFARSAHDLGGDPDRLYVSGFSSGAHLASAAMVSDWTELGFVGNPFRAATLVSGMYDLEPVRRSIRSEYVNFTDEIVDMMSAQRFVDVFDIPSIVAHGTYETPEFQRQAVDFGAALKAAGKSVEPIVAAGYNHYEMMESFGNPYSPVGRALLNQVG
jgi:arylformamidase